MTYSFRQRKKEIAAFNRATRENIDELIAKRGMPKSALAQTRALFLLSDLPIETPDKVDVAEDSTDESTDLINTTDPCSESI